MQTNNFSTPDLSNCDKEPIHLIGRIQPHGMLLAFDSAFRVKHVSMNADQFLGKNPAQLLHLPIDEIFESQTVEKLKAWLINRDKQSINPLPVVMILDNTVFQWSAIVHYFNQLLIIELEPTANKEDFLYPEYNHLLNLTIPKFQEAPDIRTLCQVAAEQIKSITQYDRVMLYQFDNDWNGEVVAEARETHLEPYLDLRYPASDIPSQARTLFMTNWTRLLADVDHIPVPIYSGSENPPPLDLSKSTLRTPSVLHIEYLKNMGVKATMTISIIFQEKLWGLIACHHYSPRFIPYEMRSACELIGRIFSYQLDIKNEHHDKQYCLKLQEVKMKLLQQMSENSDVVAGLNNYATQLLHLNSADGAAIYVGDRLIMQGITPAAAQIHLIIGWLKKNAGGIFHTHHLARHFPGAAAFKATASGILAVTISRSLGEYVIWFRKEVIQHVNWAGDPHKPVTVEDDGIRLSPRKSFEKWKEIVYEQSVPWKPCEIDTAIALRENIIEILLQVFGRIRDLNNALETTNRELEAEILERKRVEDSLRQAVEMAGEMNRLKNNFLSNMSHEIRTPINGIVGMVNIIEQELANEALKLYTEMIRESSRRLLSTLTGMLEMSRIESRTTNFTLKTCRLNTVLQNSTHSLQVLAQRKNLYLNYSDIRRQLYVLADEELLNQILNNLIDNAIKFTQEGGVTVSLNYRAQAGGGEMAVITVTDTGIGIDKSFLSKVFLPFEQESQGNNRQYEGTGVGLSITRNIVELFGGRISVESEKGKGASFTVKFPLHHSEGENTGQSESDKIFQELGTEGEENGIPKFNSVLVVEDNIINALAIQNYLKKDFETTWVRNGEEALDLISDSYFDVILMDINLGKAGIDGVEVMNQIRQKPGFERVPVFAVTGYALEGDREKFIEAGFDEYFAKPVSKNALIEAINRVINIEKR